MLSQDVVGLATQFDKFVEISGILSSHDKCKIRSENERGSFSLDTKLFLEISKKMTKIDVEQFTERKRYIRIENTYISLNCVFYPFFWTIMLSILKEKNE